MGVGAFLEPLIVVSLLAGGTLVNRDTAWNSAGTGAGWKRIRRTSSEHSRRKSFAPDISEVEAGSTSPRSEDVTTSGPWSWTSNNSSLTLLSQGEEDLDPRWHRRTLRLWGWNKTVVSPNTEVFQDRLLSRVLRRYPFLVEAWYWALIYWVYQLGRAFTTLFLDDTTVNVARRHALQVIHFEQRFHIFVELPVQRWFLERPTLMHWTNRTYSFIHIPGTILFLIVLYYLSTTRPRRILQKGQAKGVSPTRWQRTFGRLNPDLYERRRRTMAMCNLLAFIIFTAWPCMPPRLLSDPEYRGPDAQEAISYGFVDTVHSKDGESSVWTTNRFCNQYAAMPSLHFGYSFLIGLTIATLPIETARRLSWKRIGLIAGGMLYPAIILSAIVATANHFVLDAIAGAIVCTIAWNANSFLLNLLAVEDYFLWVVRIHKPSKDLVDSKGMGL